MKIIVDTDVCQNETSKHSCIKSLKINTEPCFPVRLRNSSEQSIAHYSSRQKYLSYKVSTIYVTWKSPTTEDTNIHHH